MHGQVVRVRANALDVRTDAGLVRCSLRGRLKKERAAVGKLVAVGDVVDLAEAGSGEAAIEKVRPRRSKLSRPDPHNPNKELVIVANVDAMVIVVAAANPPPDLLAVDKCTVMASAGGAASAVCVNKTDLESPPWMTAYAKAGIPVFRTSALRGDGLDELRAFLAGKTSVFVGPSGVGKSTLLNVLKPGLALKTREVSGKTGEGRHTTSWAEVVEVDGARVIDTPGLEFFGLWGVTPDTLRGHFPEFPTSGCKFRDCAHTSEPRCAVRDAVGREVVASRYENYLAIRQILVEHREMFG
jgi:ribosome biogenesis GTPase